MLKALPTDEEVEQCARLPSGKRHAGSYLYQLRAREAFEYRKLLRRRAGAWGHAPPEPPLHRRVAHFVALLIHAVEDQLLYGTRQRGGSGRSDDAVGSDASRSGEIDVPKLTNARMRKWMQSTTLAGRVSNKYF